MSSITINSNLASLTTQRRLGDTTAGLTRSFERLSSGLRINRASDDAAGLAIADNLKTDSRLFNQGIRNLNDGLSLLNVADGALTELSNIVVRIRELAEQSANGTLSNTQREAIDQEAQELSDEFTRIAQTTEVNGLKLFDGSLGELSLQAGYGERGAVTSTLGGAIGDGTFNASEMSFATGELPFQSIALDFNLDGQVDLAVANLTGESATILLGNGNGSFAESTSLGLGEAPFSINAGDFNNDGIIDLVTGNRNADNVGVFLGNGDGTFSEASFFEVGDFPYDTEVADFNRDGNVDIIVVDRQASSVSLLLGQGNGSFDAATSFAIGNNAQQLDIGDINGDGLVDVVSTGAGNNIVVLLGNGDGTLQSALTFAPGTFPFDIRIADINNDGFDDFIGVDLFGDRVMTMLGASDGSLNQAMSFSTGERPEYVEVGDFNGDGVIDLVTADYDGNSISVLLGEGDGTFGTSFSYAAGVGAKSLSIADFNNDNVLDILSGNSTDNTVTLFLGNTRAGLSSIPDFSLATKAGALQAMAPLDRKIEQLALQKGTMGAFQSRVEVAINNLQIISTNVSAAESRIRDVDVAFESAKLTRLNILQQAGAAVLAQANQAPTLALQLLI